MDESVDQTSGPETGAPLDGTVDSAVEAEQALINKDAPDNGPEESDEPAPDDADDGDAQDEDGEQPELVEIDLGGVKLSVPAEQAEQLREGVMLKADYTRKTMAVAEQVKAAQARAQQATQLYETAQTYATELALLQNIDAQIQSIQKSMDPNDMLDYSYKGTRLNELRQQGAMIGQGIAQKRAQFEQHESEQVMQQRAQAHQFLSENLPDYANVKADLIAYAVRDSGLTEPELQYLNNGANPRVMVLLDKARRWDALQASKPAVEKKVAVAQNVIRPGPATGKTSNVEILGKKLRSSGSINDAVAYEMAQMGHGKRKR